MVCASFVHRPCIVKGEVVGGGWVKKCGRMRSGGVRQCTDSFDFLIYVLQLYKHVDPAPKIRLSKTAQSASMNYNENQLLQARAQLMSRVSVGRSKPELFNQFWACTRTPLRHPCNNPCNSTATRLCCLCKPLSEVDKPLHSLCSVCLLKANCA